MTKKKITYYKIVRVFSREDKENRTIKGGLTLEEAEAHCSLTNIYGLGWRDTYEEIK